VMHAARSLGAKQVTVLHHTNSADVTGERERAGYVVGYLAAAITQPA
jgi:AmmeMemoRadiSam system protein B